MNSGGGVMSSGGGVMCRGGGVMSRGGGVMSSVYNRTKQTDHTKYVFHNVIAYIHYI